MLPTRSGLADTLTSALRASTPPAPLIDVNAQHDRFKPATLRDGLISVYTIWNVLDRLNYQTIHNWTLPWLYGYIRPVQLEALVAAVRAPGVRTYCEVGFNGGHSAAAVLYATSNVTVRSFDTGYYGKHTQQNSAFLRSVQPERFTFVDGDSSKTLPQLGQRVRAGMEPPCDVVFIDGSHKLAAVAADIRNFREAVTCGAPVLMDDLDGEPGLALKQAVQGGHFQVQYWVMYDSNNSPIDRRRVDSNVTLYVRDAKRIYNPCVRIYLHTRAIGQECHLDWHPKRCRMCSPSFQWGMGSYTSCARA